MKKIIKSISVEPGLWQQALKKARKEAYSLSSLIGMWIKQWLQGNK